MRRLGVFSGPPRWFAARACGRLAGARLLSCVKAKGGPSAAKSGSAPINAKAWLIARPLRAQLPQHSLPSPSQRFAPAILAGYGIAASTSDAAVAGSTFTHALAIFPFGSMRKVLRLAMTMPLNPPSDP